MRDRVESVGGTLTHRLDARAAAPGSTPCSPYARSRPRAAVAEVRARIAWVLAGVTSSSWWRDAVGLGAGRRAPLRDRRSPCTASRSSTARSSARAVMGALIVSRYDRHPIGWLLSVVGIVQRALAAAPRPTPTGCRRPTARAATASAASPPGSPPLFGGQLAIAGADADVPAGSGRPPRLPTLAVRRVGDRCRGRRCACSPSSSLTPTSFQLYIEGDDIGLGPRADAVASGFLAISVGLIASVVSLVHPAATQHCGAAAAAAR